MNPTDALTKNKFVDKLLSIIPEDPVNQTRFLYYLTTMIFIGLLGYSVATWFTVFTAFNFGSLFQGIFMTAICLMSLFGLKQSRMAFITTKEMYSNIRNGKQEEIKLDSVEDMMEGFNDDKVEVVNSGKELNGMKGLGIKIDDDNKNKITKGN